MCLEVSNLFNDKDVVLSKEDILKVALYAIQNKIIDVTFFCEEDGEMHYLEDFDYYVTLAKDE